MEFVGEVIIFVVGLVLGAVLMALKTKMHGDNQQTKSKLAECEQQNSQLKQEWQDHLAEYKSIATNLQEMAQHIDQQIGDAEQLLVPQEKTNHIPFFSSEATKILQTANRKKRTKSVTDNQPRDYPDKSTGMFTGPETITTEKTS